MKNLCAEIKKTGAEIKRNHSLKEHTTFKIGGRADYFVTVHDPGELAAVVKIFRKNKMNPLILGGMSNILVKEGRIKRPVIRQKGALEEFFITEEGEVRAGAAVLLKDLLAGLLKKGFGGLEFLAGIPGSVGGAVYMNAGAYGKFISSAVKQVYAVDTKGDYTETGSTKGVFSYRNSKFQGTGEMITSVLLKAVKKSRKNIKKEIAGIIKIRRGKHPQNARCAGSFFKNPAGTSAARLIEEAGLKGKKQGGARVSGMHANFIINEKNASYRDVIRLSGIIKRQVHKKFGVKLKEEVRIVK